MVNQPATQKREISRRQFLTLAGVGAVVGAVILAATQKKGLQGLLKTATTSRTLTPNQATAGKYITTSAAPKQPSPLEKLFGRI